MLFPKRNHYKRYLKNIAYDLYNKNKLECFLVVIEPLEEKIALGFLFNHFSIINSYILRKFNYISSVVNISQEDHLNDLVNIFITQLVDFGVFIDSPQSKQQARYAIESGIKNFDGDPSYILDTFDILKQEANINPVLGSYYTKYCSEQVLLSEKSFTKYLKKINKK